MSSDDDRSAAPGAPERGSGAPSGADSLVPEAVRRVLSEARDDLRTNGPSPIALDWRDLTVLLVVCISLTLYYYFGRPQVFRMHFEAQVLEALSVSGDHPWAGLLPFAWWSLCSVGLRIALPLGVIVFVLRDSPRDYGFRLWERGHAWIYALFFVLMVPVLVAASFDTSFQAKYPLLRAAGESWQLFVLYELTYGVQFFALEAFLRGFMIFALFERFGYYAVVIMTIPYMMVHFGKPLPETLGSIVAGLLLGYLALKSKSWLPGALLHWAIGLTMDGLCVLQRHL
jgi:membrane protease YdiL (CAAX protease family)